MNKRCVVSVFRNFLLSAKWGVIALCLVNVSAAVTKVSLGFGWLSGCISIVLGTPGVIGLLVLNAIFCFA